MGGAPPPKGQEECLNYFGTLAPKVKRVLGDFHTEMWKLGMSNAVMHNEVAPGQHEISPIFALTNVSADQNALCQDVLSQCAMKNGLTLLLHEKPFAGINGSGKHCNWGLNTDTGRNLYVPGKTSAEQQIFVAIVSLGTGLSLEEHLKNVIAGGPLEGYGDACTVLGGICNAVADLNARFEDRNRTAPVPFCGNRFEFRAVGSSQNIGFPLAVLNTAVAEGLSELSSMIEGGKTPRDAVALMLSDNFDAVFNGDGYSEEWQVEAARRGLPNYKVGVEAVDHLTDAKNVELFEKMKVMSERELVARKSVLFKAYANILTIEAQTMVKMMDTGVIPACAKDLKSYQGTDLGGDRATLYSNLAKATESLRTLLDEAKSVDDDRASAFYCLEKLKPQMQAVRALHDKVEGKMEAALYPY